MTGNFLLKRHILAICRKIDSFTTALVSLLGDR